MQQLNRINVPIFGLLLVIMLGGCSSTSSECVTYECRKKNLTVTLEPNVIMLGEAATLKVTRAKYNLPKFRVFIGDYDEDFNLPPRVEPQYFDGTDSLASLALLPETEGTKQIRGIIEEYRFVSKDSIDSYRYPFEIELVVKDTSGYESL